MPSTDPGNYFIPSGTLYDDFSILFWFRRSDVDSAVQNGEIISLSGTNGFFLKFTNGTSLNVNGNGTVTVDSVDDGAVPGWHHFAVVRSGSTVTVYHNGRVKGTVTVSGTKGGGSVNINNGINSMDIFDVRIFTSALTKENIQYYYGDVVNNSGNKVLPIV